VIHLAATIFAAWFLWRVAVFLFLAIGYGIGAIAANFKTIVWGVALWAAIIGPLFLIAKALAP
jgi:hypothetical protein